MKLLIPLKIGIRYTFSKKSEKLVSFISFFSILGISIGVATLIVVMSIMRGFHLEFVKNIISLNGDITIRQNFSEIDPDALIKDLKNIKFIQKAVKLSNNQALLSSEYNKIGAQIKGISVGDLLEKEKIMSSIRGDAKSFTNQDIIVGSQLAANMGVEIGDSVSIISTNTISSVMGSIPRIKTLNVLAIFDSGMYDYDSSVAFIRDDLAEKIFGAKFDSIELYTDNPDKSEYYIGEIKSKFNWIYGIRSWETSNIAMIEALKIEKISMNVILSLIIVVAAFNIVSGLFIFVKDKSKDIAILKTIGLRNSEIMLIFLTNGLINGIIACFLGCSVGVLFAKNINTIKNLLQKLSGVKIFDSAIYFFSYLPAKVDLDDLFFVLYIAIFSCVIASIYPSYRASRMNVVDILKNE